MTLLTPLLFGIGTITTWFTEEGGSVYDIVCTRTLLQLQRTKQKSKSERKEKIRNKKKKKKREEIKNKRRGRQRETRRK